VTPPPPQRRRRSRPAWAPSPAAPLVVLVAVLVAVLGRGSRGGPSRAGRGEARALPVAGRATPSPAGTPRAQAARPPSPPAIGGSPPAMATALTPAQLAKYKPNELGLIPILEYHQIVTDPTQVAQFVRTADQFRGDLNWLYQHNFYVVPLRDIFLDEINAPLGKHPVALTFDDSSAGQFRLIKRPNGALAIDPNSAVGVMEAMFAKHPDFGRGATFFTLPQSCFDWPDAADAAQAPYCKQKLEWLLAHGYEIGDHTLDHADLLDVSDATFQKEVGGGILALQRIAPNATIDLFAVPNGDYPDKGKHPEQLTWLRDGFAYQGHAIKLLGALMVGSEATVSPVSTDWDPVFTPRIQAWDNTNQETTAYWFALWARDPALLYTSDGNPDTITIPRTVDPQLAGTFDAAKARAEGKRVVRYGAGPPPGGA